LSTREGRVVVPIQQDVESAIDLVAEKVRERSCILFLGAGVHGAPPDGCPFEYPAALRPPTGAALSEQLARESGIAEQFPGENPRDLKRVSLFYEIARSRRQLVEAVGQAVQEGKRPSPLLSALAELDFPIVITTNYDRLFERALAVAGKEPRVSVYTPELEPTPDFRDPTVASPVVFKIHGDVSRPETVVLTDEDYIQFVLRMRDQKPYYPVPEIFRFQLERWTTLFVGYSLVDYNLRLLFKTLRWGVDRANIPDAYSVDCHPDPLVVEVFENQQKYLKFIVQDAWTFVPELYRAVTGKEMPDYRA
jgi:SIR2-like domain